MRRHLAAYLAYLLVLRVRAKEERLPWLAAAEALVQPAWGEVLTRNLRFIQAYELRLQGRTEDYMAMCRAEVARYRRLGARRDCWNAAWGLMLAENDSGRPEAALALGRQALAEIRAARLLRQHLVFLALWLLILAEQGDVPGTRAALAEALPLMRAAHATWMAHLSLAWLAAHEGRDGDAARLLAWYHADGKARGENSSATLLRSSLALQRLLEARLGEETLSAHKANGASLGDAQAVRLALDAEEPPGARSATNRSMPRAALCVRAVRRMSCTVKSP